MAHHAVAHGSGTLPHPTWSDPLPLQTQPQNRVPSLAHPHVYCAPQGVAPSLTDSGGLHGWILLLKVAADPPQPWSGPAPTQIPAVSNPRTPPVHPLLRCYWRLLPAAKNQVGVSKAILRSRTTALPPQRRWAAARPLPKPPLRTGGTRGESSQGAAAGRGSP